MSLNLYLISQTKNDDYDTYSDAVVAAENEAQAKTIHPDGRTLPPAAALDEDGDPIDWQYRTWVTNPQDVTARLIGKAAEGVKPLEVICASFHAG